MLGKSVKEDKEGDSLEVLQQCKTPSLGNSTEQGSTLRDLLTSTAGKLKLGSTDAGIAFAPVYSAASQVLLCSVFKYDSYRYSHLKWPKQQVWRCLV